MNAAEIHYAVGPIPPWVSLGPPFDHEGSVVREVLGDYSHLPEYDRPPKYVIVPEESPRPQHWSQDKSEGRAPIPLQFPGKPIADLKGKHSGRVAILFNGWSLANHDLHRIKEAGITIIGMNRTFVGFEGYNGPQPDYLCAVDHVWFKRDEVKDHPGLINGSTLKADHGYRVGRSMRMSPFSFDLHRDGYVNPIPATTGFMALQVAVYMGFTELFCLGLDMHGEHFDKSDGSLHFNMARGFMKQIPPVLEKAGIKCVVCGSPDSQAPFEKVSYEALFS